MNPNTQKADESNHYYSETYKKLNSISIAETATSNATVTTNNATVTTNNTTATTNTTTSNNAMTNAYGPIMPPWVDPYGWNQYNAQNYYQNQNWNYFDPNMSYYTNEGQMYGQSSGQNSSWNSYDNYGSYNTGQRNKDYHAAKADFFYNQRRDKKKGDQHNNGNHDNGNADNANQTNFGNIQPNQRNNHPKGKRGGQHNKNFTGPNQDTNQNYDISQPKGTSQLSDQIWDNVIDQYEKAEKKYQNRQNNQYKWTKANSTNTQTNIDSQPKDENKAGQHNSNSNAANPDNTNESNIDNDQPNTSNIGDYQPNQVGNQPNGKKKGKNKGFQQQYNPNQPKRWNKAKQNNRNQPGNQQWDNSGNQGNIKQKGKKKQKFNPNHGSTRLSKKECHRLSFWLQMGMSMNEAKARCIKPLKHFPEYIAHKEETFRNKIKRKLEKKNINTEGMVITPDKFPVKWQHKMERMKQMAEKRERMARETDY